MTETRKPRTKARAARAGVWSGTHRASSHLSVFISTAILLHDYTLLFKMEKSREACNVSSAFFFFHWATRHTINLTLFANNDYLRFLCFLWSLHGFAKKILSNRSWWVFFFLITARFAFYHLPARTSLARKYLAQLFISELSKQRRFWVIIKPKA